MALRDVLVLRLLHSYGPYSIAYVVMALQDVLVLRLLNSYGPYSMAYIVMALRWACFARPSFLSATWAIAYLHRP